MALKSTSVENRWIANSNFERSPHHREPTVLNTSGPHAAP